MYKRKTFEALEAHLPKKQVTAITGMRRVGKTTAVKYLLGQVEHRNKLYLDLERIEYRHLFNQPSYADIERGLAQLGIDFSAPAVIALDEIQLVKNIPSVIKSLYDTYGVKFIVTGSSSFYLKNHFSESLAGRKKIFEMWPLDFQEFLVFREAYTPHIELEKNRDFLRTFYGLYSGLYEEFIRYGGFPEVVLADSTSDREDFLSDIINSHIELDIKLLSDFEMTDSLYKLMLLMAGRAGSKIDFSKIASIIGLNRHKVKDYLLLLEHTYFIRLIKPLAKGIDKELTSQPKAYFSDTGVLNKLGKGLSGGQVFENAIANQLARLGKLNYFEKSKSWEIDFVLDETVAYEVKETPAPHHLNTLKYNAESIGLSSFHLVGRYPGGSGFHDFIWGGNVF
ncbi:MAG: ATP-binding protein [Lewinellaceae bacterium]|nr:ATP-binding protein [Phaeodactylibacter sp.]MCB9352076.1 ATP-binding protein [Lewinellaceae bacterium]